MGGGCGGSSVTPHRILRLCVDFAQEVSVGREHDLLDLRAVVWAWK